MSAFNIKSTVLAGRDASPKILQEATLARGLVREGYGVAKVSNAGADLNAAGTVIRLVTVPSTARLSNFEYCGTSCGTGVLDVAVWYPTYIPQGGGNFLAASLSATLISSSTFLSNINIPDTDQVFVTAYPTLALLSMQKQEQPLWQLLGLSSDPEIHLDVGFTVRTACAINGYVGMRVKYAE